MKRFYNKARNQIMIQMFATPDHVLYENFQIESKITDIMNTKLEVRSLMTVDNSLEQNAGMKKLINKYTYSGEVEKLEKGGKNSDEAKGKVTQVGTWYDVNRYQHTFVYNDMDVMQDPLFMDVATKGASTVVANEVKTEYFAELDKISNRIEYTTFGTDAIADALGEIGCEAEDDLFIIMGSDNKAAIRKDDDFIRSQQGEILYTGQFGTLSGVPVIFSKLVPKNVAYLTKKDAVKFFVKREGSVEQDRDIETKDNTVVYERHGVIALVDDTESAIMTKALPELTVSLTAAASKLTLAAQTTASGYSFKYLVSDEPIVKPYLESTDTSKYTVYTENTDINTTTKKYVAVVKVKNSTGTVAAWGMASEQPTA